MNIAIISDEKSWINDFLVSFIETLKGLGHKVVHKYLFDKSNSYDVVFLLSYSKIISAEELRLNKHNLVVHESNLPEGKGWSPLTWQVIEGKNDIRITLFEADEKVDSGKIYLRKNMHFNGDELVDELRKKQAEYTLEMCLEFINNYNKLINSAYDQAGESTYYPRRYPQDSELDINKTMNEQFNLLRTVDNDKYPAFFYKNNKKYIIKIFKDK